MKCSSSSRVHVLHLYQHLMLIYVDLWTDVARCSIRYRNPSAWEIKNSVHDCHNDLDPGRENHCIDVETVPLNGCVAELHLSYDCSKKCWVHMVRITLLQGPCFRNHIVFTHLWWRPFLFSHGRSVFEWEKHYAYYNDVRHIFQLYPP